MENKKKRFYKVGEVVWVVGEKKEGKVKAIHKEEKKVTVVINGKEEKLDLWAIDKLKYKAKEEQSKTEVLTVGQKSVTDLSEIKEAIELIKKVFYPEVFFAPVREGAIIPSKRVEDAGLDIYAELSDDKFKVGEFVEIFCPKLATTLVPTGLATALPTTHYLNLKHERGSTGVQSMSVLAGVVDSGFRNEMFIALTPLKHDVVITNRVDKVEVVNDTILYPLSKAISQATVDLVPETKISVLTYEELQNIPSERGMTMLGQSGK